MGSRPAPSLEAPRGESSRAEEEGLLGGLLVVPWNVSWEHVWAMGRGGRQLWALERAWPLPASLLSSFLDLSLSPSINSGLSPTLRAHALHHNGKGNLLSSIGSLPGKLSTLERGLLLLLFAALPAGSVWRWS